MSRRIRIFQVDAFTTDRFTGNPAGVVLDADSLGDAEMLAIARELNNADRRLRLTLALAKELMGTPRHLSQHPGGFVLTLDRLDEMVPVEPAAMDNRQVIEWDKDDIDALKFMKVDVLGLGMLGCMRRASWRRTPCTAFFSSTTSAASSTWTRCSRHRRLARASVPTA